MSISVVRGDILSHEADYIVNPANTHLRHTGGLARVIDRAATGQDLPAAIFQESEVHDKADNWRADHFGAPNVATGTAYLTTAGLLPYKAVVHAVGPIWAGGRHFEPQLLGDAYHSALYAAWAHAQGDFSILFPGISCGIFGYPHAEAARIALHACRYWSDRNRNRVHTDIKFVLLDDDVHRAFAGFVQ